MTRLAIISNPASGRNRRRAPLPTLAGVHGVVSDGADAVPAILDELLAPAPDVLAVDGGDGTMQAVLTHLLADGAPAGLPPLAMLPAGSTNMTARDVCGVVDHRRALRALLSLRDRERRDWPLRYRSVLRVRAPGGAAACGLFFGIGAIVGGVRYWDESLGHGRGLGQAASGAALVRAALGVLRGERRFVGNDALRVAADGAAPCERHVLLALATTMDSLLLGMRPFWGEGGAPIAATLVDAHAEGLIRRIPALVRGDGRAGLTAANGYDSFRAERLSLELDGAWVVDGEVFETAGRLELDALGPLPFVDLERLA